MSIDQFGGKLTMFKWPSRWRNSSKSQMTICMLTLSSCSDWAQAHPTGHHHIAAQVDSIKLPRSLYAPQRGFSVLISLSDCELAARRNITLLAPWWGLFWGWPLVSDQCWGSLPFKIFAGTILGFVLSWPLVSWGYYTMLVFFLSWPLHWSVTTDQC